MALGKAIRFIRLARNDSELRKACNQMPSTRELLNILDFDKDEFENAFSMELVKCQSAEDANGLYQLKEWFQNL